MVKPLLRRPPKKRLKKKRRTSIWEVFSVVMTMTTEPKNVCYESNSFSIRNVKLFI